MWKRYKRLKKFTRYCLISLLIAFGAFGWWQEIRVDSSNGDVGNDSIPQNLLPISSEHPDHHGAAMYPWQKRPASQLFAELPSQLTGYTQAQAADCNKVACIAITFDDGPDPVSTNMILDTLARHRATATFFLIGNRAAANVDVVRRITREGSEVGNHSFNHPLLTKIPASQIEEQVSGAQRAIVSAGIAAPIAMRPPYGAINQSVSNQIPMPIVLWNVDPRDWAEKEPAKITQNVSIQAKRGSIVLLHDRIATAAAMEAILDDLQKRFVLVSVTQLLNIKAESRGLYYSQFTRR